MKLFGKKLRLFGRSAYRYSSAEGLRLVRKTKSGVERGTKEVFADGVAFGRSLEREARKR